VRWRRDTRKTCGERVVSIVKEGDSAREAARLLNVGASTAIRWIERWTTIGGVEAKPGIGPKRGIIVGYDKTSRAFPKF
jgi:transposase